MTSHHTSELNMVSTAPEDVVQMAAELDLSGASPDFAATLRALAEERDRLREALEAVDSEIILDGHLQELVSTALDMSDNNMGSSAIDPDPQETLVTFNAAQMKAANGADSK